MQLVIHHVEPLWDDFYDRYYLERLITHLQKTKYDKIYYSSLEGNHITNLAKEAKKCGEEFDALAQTLEYHPVEFVEWDYGFIHEDNYSIFPQDRIVPVKTHHELVYIYDWMYCLDRPLICGGHKRACLQSFIETLDYMQVDYRVIGRLVYGK